MLNKKGTALMQVLLVTVVIATLGAFIMRLSISRTTTAAQAVKMLNAKNLIEGCNAQLQAAIVQEEIKALTENRAVVLPSTYTCYGSSGEEQIPTVVATLGSGGSGTQYNFEINATEAEKL
ncbi:hypothetical protein Dip510_001282 [Elusimicrobium posterum]|uniref:hypothetical protein n=1 Tax=Elusimicrobium posterum TaxID=3116653 RepID=UPI003C756737